MMEQKTIPVPKTARWLMAVGITAALVVIPFLYYRLVYTETKRLRVVTPGRFYRCGRMSAAGFEHAIREYKIKTVINLMEEETEPKLTRSFFDRSTISERELCQKHGVRYEFLYVHLISRKLANQVAPQTVNDFRAILDDPKNYPVMIHCRAGLHRTGVLAAFYRMEYEGWSATKAWNELKENGFGDNNCYANNDYVQQYIFSHYTRKQAENKTDKGRVLN